MSTTRAAHRPLRSVARAMVAAVLALIAAVALVGPWLAPHSPTAVVGLPYSLPGTVDGAPLGTDYLGRDVLSRVLNGGLAVVTTGVVATVASSLLGAAIGLTAALYAPRRPWVDGVLIRTLDAVTAIPPLLLLLLIVAALPGHLSVVLAVVVTGVPLTARVLRASAASVVQRSHVEVALARGERLPWLIGREVLPLVSAPLLADAGIRFVQSVYAVVAIGFLGLGTGAADWGVLISEAMPGATLQPWALAVPVLIVAALAVATNVLADDVGRRSRRLLA
ncbi:MAG: peptide/nickel transport system permease protein [Micromonosporaceae bacterium]|nr:peptide/nickel transport system permease protein [Micromonosporaceae bacterium]